jgi:homoserine/homoserine lactone efflux protein
MWPDVVGWGDALAAIACQRHAQVPAEQKGSPMTPEILLAFTLTCVLLALTPGPNMSLIMANTLTHGLAAGLATVAGTSTGLALLVAGAALGMSSAMVLFAQWFDLIRLVGALYLVYLGARQLLALRRARGAGQPAPAPARRGGGWYIQGLLVSLANPKVVLFLGAFLPQFVDPKGDLSAQLTVLALLFVAVLVLVDVGYTLAAARARRTLAKAHLRLIDGAAGVLLLLGGVALGIVRRP